MSNSTERWWERVPRILGGWGFAVLVFLRFPFPEAELVDGTLVRTDPGVVSWGIYVGLIAFSIGIAHSTVTGIVLGQLGRAYSFVWRRGKERRAGVTSREAEGGGRTPGATLLPARRRADSRGRTP